MSSWKLTLLLIIMTAEYIFDSLDGVVLYEWDILPCFCHTDRLLLHSFMDADSVLFFDAVEFINAAQTTI